MIVYVVTDGEYSDYHIEAVFTDKEQAELFCATRNLSAEDIKEYDTEEHKFETATPIYSRWHFAVEEKKGETKIFLGDVTLTTKKEDVFKKEIHHYYGCCVDAYITLEKDATMEQAEKALYHRYAKWKYEQFA